MIDNFFNALKTIFEEFGISAFWISIIIVIVLGFVFWWKFIRTRDLKSRYKNLILILIIVVPVLIGILTPWWQKLLEPNPPKDKLAVLVTKFYQSSVFEGQEAGVFVQSLKFKLEELEKEYPVKILYTNETLGEATAKKENERATEIGRKEGMHLVLWGVLVRSRSKIQIRPHIIVSNPVFDLGYLEGKFPTVTQVISAPTEIESKKALLEEELVELIKLIVGIAKYYSQDFQEALNYFKLINQDFFYPEQLYYIGAIQMKTGSSDGYKGAYQTYKELEKYYKTVKVDSIKLATVHSNIGGSLLMKGEIDSAISYYNKARHFFKTKQIISSLLSVYNNLAVLYIQNSKWDQAIDTLKKCLKYKKGEFKKWSFLANVYTNMGTAYLYKGNLDSSMFYFKKSLRLAKKQDDEINIAMAYNNMSLVYFNKKNYEAAIKYAVRSLVINMKLENKKGLSHNYNVLGIYYLQIKNNKEAINSLKMAAEYKEELGDSIGLAEINGNLGIAYKRTDQLDKALAIYEKSLKYFKRNGDKYRSALTSGNIAEIYKKQDKLELALEYAEYALKNFKIVKAPEIDKAERIVNEIKEEMKK